MKRSGVDVGSTTVKAVCVAWRGAAEGEPSGFAKAWRGAAEGEPSGYEGEPSGYQETARLQVLWQDYQRHNTRQAEKVLEFLGRMEDEAGVEAGRARVFFTGSGAGLLAPLVGAKTIQEVVAVAACVERLHPHVRFVSETGGGGLKAALLPPPRPAPP